MGFLPAGSAAATPAPGRLPPQLCAGRAGLGVKKGCAAGSEAGRGGVGRDTSRRAGDPPRCSEGTGTLQVRRRRLAGFRRVRSVARARLVRPLGQRKGQVCCGRGAGVGGPGRRSAKLPTPSDVRSKTKRIGQCRQSRPGVQARHSS